MSSSIDSRVASRHHTDSRTAKRALLGAPARPYDRSRRLSFRRLRHSVAIPSSKRNARPAHAQRGGRRRGRQQPDGVVISLAVGRRISRPRRLGAVLRRDDRRRIAGDGLRHAGLFGPDPLRPSRAGSHDRAYTGITTGTARLDPSANAVVCDAALLKWLSQRLGSDDSLPALLDRELPAGFASIITLG